MIYITGDTHGEQARFYDKRLLPNGELTKNDYLIVCGDFGYLFKNDSTEQFFLDDLEKLPYTVAFVDGNHENFPAIYSYPIVNWHGGKVHKIRENIVHLMRGEVFEVNGRVLFAFGGAYSTDKYMRTEGYSWWKEEMPTDEEYKNAARNLEKHNFKVDYIITHTMPKEMIFRYGKHPNDHDIQLTDFLEWVRHQTDFKHWYCGHWHDDFNLTENFSILRYDLRKVL